MALIHTSLVKDMTDFELLLERNLIVTDIVIDIETAATKPHKGKILQVSLCLMNRNTNTKIVLDNVVRHYGTESDENTLQWWQDTNPEYYKHLTADSPRSTKDMRNVLQGITNLYLALAETQPDTKVTIWGNSPRFDMTFLESAFDAESMSIPWDFRDEGCFRTVRRLAEELGVTTHSEEYLTKKTLRGKPENCTDKFWIPHNSAYDALYEAYKLADILDELDTQATVAANI